MVRCLTTCLSGADLEENDREFQVPTCERSATENFGTLWR